MLVASILPPASARPDELDSLLGGSRPRDRSEGETAFDAPGVGEEDSLQSRSPADALAQPHSGRRPVEEIVVTATKREESVRDLPVTIDAFTGEDLIERGATNLEEIVKLSPGVSKNGNRVVMRGIGTSALGSFNIGEEVGRFFGDTSLNAPSTRGALADLDPYDMRTVEVLKGPQGTLHGGSALSGAVRYVPNEPSFDGLAGGLRLGIGPTAHSDDPQREIAFMLNGSLASSFGVRVVGSQRERAGAIDDLRAGVKDIDDRRTRQGRLLAAWQPFDALSFAFTALAWEEAIDHNGFTDRPHRYETRIKRIPEPGVMKSRLLSFRTEYALGPLTVVGAGNLLKTSWFSILDLAPILGTQDAPPETPDIIDTAADVPSFEVRVVSDRPSEAGWWILRNWSYLAGVFVMDAEQQVNSLIVTEDPLPPPIPGISADTADQRARTDAEEIAFFFDLTRGFFGDHLELNLGGRLARTRTKNLTFSVVEGERVNPYSDGATDSRFNPKAALTFRLSEDFSIYGSAAQGFRFGGVNVALLAGLPVDNIPRTFTSDTLWNYEVGLRSDWLDGLLRFDVAGFRIDWTDLQIVQISDTAQNFVSNVGGARILGVETGILTQLPAGFSLAFRGAYIDPRTTEFFDSDNGPVESGTRLPLTPYVSANPSINWLGAWRDWLLNASLSNAYSGSTKNELINTVKLPSFHSLSGNFRVLNPSLPLSPGFSVSGINLLNQAIPHVGIPAVTGPERVFILSRPRTVLFNVELGF